MPRKLVPSQIHKMEKGKLYGELAERVKHEPKPVKILTPRVPPWFSKDEKKEWNRIRELLASMGLFNAANVYTMETLAVNVVLLRKINKILAEEGLVVVVTERGKTFERPHPMLTHRNRIEVSIRADLDRLGLNTLAISKAGVALAHAAKRDELDDILD